MFDLIKKYLNEVNKYLILLNFLFPYLRLMKSSIDEIVFGGGN